MLLGPRVVARPADDLIITFQTQLKKLYGEIVSRKTAIITGALQKVFFLILMPKNGHNFLFLVGGEYGIIAALIERNQIEPRGC